MKEALYLSLFHLINEMRSDRVNFIAHFGHVSFL